jgi:hypothetical protein
MNSAESQRQVPEIGLILTGALEPAAHGSSAGVLVDVDKNQHGAADKAWSVAKCTLKTKKYAHLLDLAGIWIYWALHQLRADRPSASRVNGSLGGADAFTAERTRTPAQLTKSKAKQAAKIEANAK